jgi:3'(2'), 5'-bisphosphate nucleotidase
MEINNDFLINNFDHIAETLFSASSVIKKHYKKNIQVDNKSDNTPVTKADLEASNTIYKHLKEFAPHIEVITEENEKDFDYESRKNLAYFWLVDPLDGTKHFINEDDQFSINIALLENNKPIFGIIYSPIEDVLYFAYKGLGSFKIENFSQNKHISYAEKISTNKPVDKINLILGSASSIKEPVKQLLSKMNTDFDVNINYYGSSLKMCQIAEGKQDIYPRFGLTGEWDTAAATVILEEAGGFIFTVDSFTDLSYNKQSFLNPEFIASSISPERLKGYL